jgi:hypothetical protein
MESYPLPFEDGIDPNAQQTTGSNPAVAYLGYVAGGERPVNGGLTEVLPEDKSEEG